MSLRTILLAFAILATEAFTCYICKEVVEKKYADEALSREAEYRAQLLQAEKKSSEISKQYLEAAEELANVHSTNLSLTNRLHELERATTKRSDKDTRCVVTRTTCPNISAGVAADITELTKRADESALYARQCYLWIQQLQGTGNRPSTEKPAN